MLNGEGEGEAHYDDAQLSWTALSFFAQFLSSALFSKLSEAKLFTTTGGETKEAFTVYLEVQRAENF